MTLAEAEQLASKNGWTHNPETGAWSCSEFEGSLKTLIDFRNNRTEPMTTEPTESRMPERDALWAKHDGLTPALATDLLEFSGKLEIERDELKAKLLDTRETLEHLAMVCRTKRMDRDLGMIELTLALTEP